LDDGVPNSAPLGPRAARPARARARCRRRRRSGAACAREVGRFTLWGTARGEHAALVRELGATPIDYQREDFTRVLPGGFDVIVDGVGEDGYRRSYAALKRGGLLCAIGFSASVQARRGMLPILSEIARLYLWRLLPDRKRARFYSVNVMRARHPAWFKEDLERLFGLLATREIRPRVAERISFDEVPEAHRRLESGGLDGKLVLCPDLA